MGQSLQERTGFNNKRLRKDGTFAKIKSAKGLLMAIRKNFGPQKFLAIRYLRFTSKKSTALKNTMNE